MECSNRDKHGEQQLESRNVLFNLISYLLLTVLLAALSTPPIYVFIRDVFFSGDSPWPYSRVFHRVALFWAIILAVILRGKLQLSTMRRYFAASSVGDRAKVLQHLLFGFAASLFISGLALVWMLDGTFDLQIPDASRSLYLLVKAFFSGFIISLIEEGFFRVLLFGVLIRSLGVTFAALCSSLIYALVHFIHPSKSWQLEGASPLYGLEYILETFHLFGYSGFIYGYLGLFLVGVGLCFVFWRTQSVFLCIGLHSGWVVLMKIQTHFLALEPGVVLPAALGRRYFLVGEPIGWVSIVVVFLLTYSLYATRD